MFKISKEFVDGYLKGLTYTEKTTVNFALGKTYKKMLRNIVLYDH